MNFSWREAKLNQLYLIAYSDDEEMALASDRREAAEELLRRKKSKRKHQRVQHKIKAVR